MELEGAKAPHLHAGKAAQRPAGALAQAAVAVVFLQRSKGHLPAGQGL